MVNQKPEKGKKSESLKETPMPPLPFEKHVRHGKKEVSLEEGLKMLQEMQKKHQEIEKKLDEVYQQTGWSPRALKSYLENSGNFDSESWERLKKERESLMSSLNLPSDDSSKNPPYSKEGKPKEKRSKPAGARRNWLPMR